MASYYNRDKPEGALKRAQGKNHRTHIYILIVPPLRLGGGLCTHPYAPSICEKERLEVL